MVKTFLRIAAIVLGAISCANLAWKGFDLQIGLWTASLLDGWDALLAHSVGLIVGLLINKINNLAAQLNWDLHLSLYGHWKHIYVVLHLYFVKDAAHFGDLNLKRQMWTSYLAGFFVSGIAAVGAGLLDPSTTRYLQNLAIAAIPIAGFFTYLTVMIFTSSFWSREYIDQLEGRTNRTPFWQFFLVRIYLAALRSIIGIGIISIGLLFVKSQSPSVVMLSILWVVLALEWLRGGWQQAKYRVKNLNLKWHEALIQTGNINLGLDMLATVGLAATLLAVNIGPQ